MIRRLTVFMFLAALLTLCSTSEAWASKHPRPVLGFPLWNAASNTQGFGDARPTSIYNGGDPTGYVSGVTWSSWGGARAIGHGRGWYVSPTEFVSQGHHASAVIIASNLGICDGHWVYRTVGWYFPARGEKFSSRDNESTCNTYSAH